MCQQIGQIAYDAVVQTIGRDMQHARAIARIGRMIGNQCARQLEIEGVDAHD